MYIDTIGGRIELLTQACQVGEGKRATFIYRASSGWYGAATGCWIKQDDKFVIRWLKSIRPNMPVMDTDYVRSYDVREARRISEN